MRNDTVYKDYKATRNKVKTEMVKLLREEQEKKSRLIAEEILKNSGKILIKKTKSKTHVGYLKWCNRNGNDKQAQTDDEKATALLDFF